MMVLRGAFRAAGSKRCSKRSMRKSPTPKHTTDLLGVRPPYGRSLAVHMRDAASAQPGWPERRSARPPALAGIYLRRLRCLPLQSEDI
jgi:hypothetical protein